MDASDTGIKERVMDALLELAGSCQLKRLILFGSRARGDYLRTSDIDLAVSGGDIVRFTLDAEDEIPTLLKFDIVNLDGPVNSDLLHSIEKEGIIIYEKV